MSHLVLDGDRHLVEVLVDLVHGDVLVLVAVRVLHAAGDRRWGSTAAPELPPRPLVHDDGLVGTESPPSLGTSDHCPAGSAPVSLLVHALVGDHSVPARGRGCFPPCRRTSVP